MNQQLAQSQVMSEQLKSWRQATMMTALLCVALLGLFNQTVLSLVNIWNNSETFAHGFFILPITLFLIWRIRDELFLLTPQPNYWGLPLLAVLGLGWLLGHLTTVDVVQQIALVGMLQVAIFTVLGWQVTKKMLFPLFFLVFAVPIGKELIPQLMDFTANFTVRMLQITGIPVFKEGTFFEIPSGRWSVVEGCSGVRYLIAAVVLGSLYAYLTYRTIFRRTVFVLISFVVPVIANGMRAYIIVMIAYLSDNKLAHGIDHFIYGWVFFGFVMLLLFWIGSFWREDEKKFGGDVKDEPGTVSLGRPLSYKHMVTVVCGAFLILSLWPASAFILAQRNDATAVNLIAPQERSGWQMVPAPLTVWRPHYVGMDAALEQTYVKDGQKVSLYLAYYRYQRQDAELVNIRNVLIRQKDPVWRDVNYQPASLQADGKQIPITTAKLRSDGQNLLVYYWDWFAGEYPATGYEAKLLEVKNTLLGRREDAAGMFVSAEFGVGTEEAQATLERFIADMYPAIEASLDAAESSSH